MLIVALVLAVVGLAALVAAVVTSNELVAWVCIAASVLGVVLLIVDALRERRRGDSEHDSDAAPALADHPVNEDSTAYSASTSAVENTYKNFDAEYPDDEPDAVSQTPESDTVSDDEPEVAPSAEEAAMHTVTDTDDAAADDRSTKS